MRGCTLLFITVLNLTPYWPTAFPYRNAVPLSMLFYFASESMSEVIPFEVGTTSLLNFIQSKKDVRYLLGDVGCNGCVIKEDI